MALTYVGISGIVIIIVGIILTLIGFYYLYQQSSTTQTTSATRFRDTPAPTPVPSRIAWWTIALIVFGVLGIILGAVLLYTGRSGITASISTTSFGATDYTTL